ncbi:aminotransferase class V-fold PLP-dependent enzyme [Paenibacillus sabuli]|uniref:aminotransferase class V-fold PLP-dependent enzyme n=1 Tax=Paenibacillus sabuli TaxID=2772509 RepID=UPI00295B3AD3|nr:aminotransferase class V-fold PLP-dependent enzyme [Paenibacillus sabuli]
MQKENEVLYFDHAATSWPKPQAVLDAVMSAMQHESANPGRGSHRMAVKASRVLFGGRRSLAKLFGIRNPNDIAFTLNTTAALNVAIKGFLKPGDHVIATAVEHNSVRRPLTYIREHGVEVSYVDTDEHGELDAAMVESAIRPHTALIIVNHSSNLLGSILPVADIGEVARRHGVRLLVDAAQSAGVLDIDVEAMGIDMLAFPGHKALLGPQGTGGLYLHPELDLEPLLHGGTGSQSEAEGQPDIRPDRYEAGTPNTPGIAGLRAGVETILDVGTARIRAHERELTLRLMDGLQALKGLRILGPPAGRPRTGIVSFVASEVDPSELAFILDQHYGIAVRAGYHCTPLAHGQAGTSSTGAVRASVGWTSTTDEVDAFIAAMKEIMKHY